MIKFQGKFSSDAFKCEVSISVVEDDMVAILNALEAEGFEVDEDTDEIMLTVYEHRTTEIWVEYTKSDGELYLKLVDNPS